MTPALWALQVLNGKYPESATSALQPNQAAAMRGGGGGGEPSTRLELDAWALQRTAREAEVLRRQDGARAAEVYAAAARGNQREERGGGGDHGGGGQEEERGGAGQKTLPRPASVPSVYQGASAYHGAGEGPLAARLRAARGGGAVMALQRSHSAGERPPSAGPRFRPASPFRFFVTQPEDDDEGIGDDVDGYVDDIVSVAASLKVPEVVKKPTAEKRPPLPTEEKNWALKTWITSDNVKATIKSVQRARAAFANDSEHGLLQYELASRRREIDPAEISSLSYKLGRSSTMMRLKAAEDKKSHRPATAGAAAKRGAPGGGQRARPSSAPPAAAAAGKKRPGTAKGKKKKATKKKAAPLVPKPPEIKWASAEEFMQAKFPRVAAMSVAQHAAAREIEDVRARFQAAGLADPGEALERALGVPSDRPAEVCLAGLRPQGAGLGKDHLRLDSPRKKKKKIVKKKKLTRRKKGGSRSRSSSRSVARRSKSPGKIKRR